MDNVQVYTYVTEIVIGFYAQAIDLSFLSRSP
jgi:hypothetical protein